jgi:hypothetical protein
MMMRELPFLLHYWFSWTSSFKPVGDKEGGNAGRKSEIIMSIVTHFLFQILQGKLGLNRRHQR